MAEKLENEKKELLEQQEQEKLGTEEHKLLKDSPDHRIKELEDLLKRLQADFENFQKRTDKERKDVLAFASEKLIIKLLTVADEFDEALKAAKDSPKEELVKGFEMLHKNFAKILSDEGVKHIHAQNVKADPYLHEVILKGKKDGVQDGFIIDEIQKGYKLKDKVIRYSKVRIAGGN